MMSLKAKLKRLQKKAQTGEVPIVVQHYADEPIRVRGQEMTTEMFLKHYPRGRLIRVVFVGQDKTAYQLKNDGSKVPIA